MGGVAQWVQHNPLSVLLDKPEVEGLCNSSSRVQQEQPESLCVLGC